MQSTEALLSGMSWPALTLLFKRGLSETELPAATCLENVIFASQVLLGTGLGVVLFQQTSVFTLLAIDAASFLGSLLMLWLAGRRFSAPSLPLSGEEEAPCATALADVDRSAKTQPAHFAGAGGRRLTGHGTTSGTGAATPSQDAAGLALPLLFARSMGQLCGPMLLKDSLTRFAAHTPRIIVCLGIFWPLMECCRCCPGGWHVRWG